MFLYIMTLLRNNSAMYIYNRLYLKKLTFITIYILKASKSLTYGVTYVTLAVESPQNSSNLHKLRIIRCHY